MTNVRNEFNNAVDALRSALKAAIDDPTFDRNNLSEVWRHYQGLQTIAERIPGGATSAFTGDLGLSTSDYINFNLNDTVAAAGNIEINTPGQDVITFGA
jgi:hypothetical protein